MEISSSVRKIANGRWEPAEPRYSLRRALAWVEERRFLSARPLRAIANSARKRRAPK